MEIHQSDEHVRRDQRNDFNPIAALTKIKVFPVEDVRMPTRTPVVGTV